MERVPFLSPVGILSALAQAAGLLTLTTLLIGIVRLKWRRDGRWLVASGGMLLLTALLLVATFAVAVRSYGR